MKAVGRFVLSSEASRTPNTKLPPQLSKATTPLKAISSRVKHLRLLCLIDRPKPYTYHRPQKLLCAPSVIGTSTKINPISCSYNSYPCQHKAIRELFSRDHLHENIPSHRLYHLLGPSGLAALQGLLYFFAPTHELVTLTI